MSLKFSGKVVLITGAASGIGAATAERFSTLGAKLSLIDINLEELQKIQEKCTQQGTAKPLIIKADMTKEEDVKQMIEKTIETYKRLDILVNNAGIYELGTCFVTNLQQYDKIMNINARGVFQLTILAIPHLVASKGNIINIASIASLKTAPANIAYTLSKGLIDHFTRNLALDLAPKGVRVNSVNPGLISTNIFKHAGMEAEFTKKFTASETLTHPLGRIGQPEDVVKAIVFLSSDDADFITGVSLAVDGGRHLT